MSWKSFAACLALAVVVLVPPALAAPPDRLDRFRALAATQFAAGQVSEDSLAAYREAYALLDEEIVESLASGGVFASLGFLQDRLDAFSEAWGATVVRLVRVGDVLVGAFQLSDAAVGNSVRVYGHLKGEAALLATLSHDGRPSVHVLPGAARGAGQFLVAWEGSLTGRGTRSLRLDLARPQGDGVRLTWSTAQLFPDGLMARAWGVRGSDVRVRYELHYPGWVPGCDGQTEQEDVYRVAGSAVTRVSRRQVNAWHRAFHVAVAQLFDAVSTGNAAALARLVPDANARHELPRSLVPEPACDARETSTPERVSVAAREAVRPWQLVFQRSRGGWRLVRATPVLQ